MSVHPSPKELCDRLDPSLKLWLLTGRLEHLSQRPSHVTHTDLNEVMVMLHSTAKSAGALCDNRDVIGMSLFASECEAALKTLENLRNAGAEAVGESFKLPDLNACIATGSWVNPIIIPPPKFEEKKPEMTIDAYRKLAGTNLGHIKVLPSSHVEFRGRILIAIEWMQNLPSDPALSSYTTQLALSTVEDLMFSHVIRHNFSSHPGSCDAQKDAENLVKLVHLYSQAARAFLGMKAADARMKVQLMGREVLVKMVAYCEIHAACTRVEPLLGGFGAAIHWDDFDHLVFEDKQSIDCAMLVSKHLKLFDKEDKEVFSLRDGGNEATLVCLHDVHDEQKLEALLWHTLGD